MRVGIIGGMSWQSTLTYYQQINEQVNARKGGLHSADLLIHSVDFQAISEWQHHDNWPALGNALAESARDLYRGGADVIVIATNTMHKVADKVSQATPLPLLHIVDATAKSCHRQQLTTVGLLGTRFTMEQSFYRERLEARGVRVITPDSEARDAIHDIIYNKLCKGVISDADRQTYLEIMQTLHDQGAQGMILGCTEIGMLVKQKDTAIPLIDTTAAHVTAIVDSICS